MRMWRGPELGPPCRLNDFRGLHGVDQDLLTFAPLFCAGRIAGIGREKALRTAVFARLLRIVAGRTSAKPCITCRCPFCLQGLARRRRADADSGGVHRGQPVLSGVHTSRLGGLRHGDRGNRQPCQNPQGCPQVLTSSGQRPGSGPKSSSCQPRQVCPFRYRRSGILPSSGGAVPT